MPDGPFYDESYIAPPPQAAQGQAPAGPRMGQPDTQNVDTLGRLQSQMGQMIAPYREMAAKITSPYATMRPDSWLATQHPKAAGILDNVFLTGAMTPGPQGPEGVGGGISRAFQGLVGAQQYRRQQAVMQALLPYQMLEPQLKAMGTMSEAEKNMQMAKYYGVHGNYLQDMLPIQQEKAAAAGLQAQNRLTQAAAMDRDAWGEVPPKDPAHITPAEQKAHDDVVYKNMTKKGAGGTSYIERRVQDEENQQIAGGGQGFSPAQRTARGTQIAAEMAGNRTGATESAKAPFEFQARERKEAFRTYDETRTAKIAQLPKPLDERAWDQTDEGMVYSGPAAKTAYAAYQKQIRDENAKQIALYDQGRQKLSTDLDKYGRDTASINRGVGFNEWQEIQSQGAGATSTTGRVNKEFVPKKRTQ